MADDAFMADDALDQSGKGSNVEGRESRATPNNCSNARPKVAYSASRPTSGLAVCRMCAFQGALIFNLMNWRSSPTPPVGVSQILPVSDF